MKWISVGVVCASVTGKLYCERSVCGEGGVGWVTCVLCDL